MSNDQQMRQQLTYAGALADVTQDVAMSLLNVNRPDRIKVLVNAGLSVGIAEWMILDYLNNCQCYKRRVVVSVVSGITAGITAAGFILYLYNGGIAW